MKIVSILLIVLGALGVAFQAASIFVGGDSRPFSGMALFLVILFSGIAALRRLNAGKRVRSYHGIGAVLLLWGSVRVVYYIEASFMSGPPDASILYLGIPFFVCGAVLLYLDRIRGPKSPRA